MEKFILQKGKPGHIKALRALRVFHVQNGNDEQVEELTNILEYWSAELKPIEVSDDKYARLIMGEEEYSYLTKAQYFSQIKNPSGRWKCPKTGAFGTFDLMYFQSAHIRD